MGAVQLRRKTIVCGWFVPILFFFHFINEFRWVCQTKIQVEKNWNALHWLSHSETVGIMAACAMRWYIPWICIVRQFKKDFNARMWMWPSKICAIEQSVIQLNVTIWKISSFMDLKSNYVYETIEKSHYKFDVYASPMTDSDPDNSNIVDFRTRDRVKKHNNRRTIATMELIHFDYRTANRMLTKAVF